MKIFRAALVYGVLCILMSSIGISGGLDDLGLEKNYRVKRVSSYDESGGNADGGQNKPIKPGETRTLGDIKGPGSICHIWFTIACNDPLHLRKITLRMYWDGEKDPSVEAPVGDFFGLGHGVFTSFESGPIKVGNGRGLNCYWPMPFEKSARITVSNDSRTEIGAFYYYLDYKEFRSKLPKDTLYFHARYRQEFPCTSREPYTLLEAKGRGHYAGTILSVRSNEDGWWGEGDDRFYIDGEEKPSLHGTGTEDYFCHAWGMGKGQTGEFFGTPLTEGWDAKGRRNTMYRFHVLDAVPFTKSIKVTLEHGHDNDRADDWASVAFWYQTEPHVPFGEVPDIIYRLTTEERMEEYKRAGLWDQARKDLDKIIKDVGSQNVKKDMENMKLKLQGEGTIEQEK